MTKARTNASVAPAVGRNMIINGAMNLSQRAVSVTGLGAASGYFTVDRWKILRDATAGRFTMTQTADGPNGISANCLKLDCTTADASIAAGEHIILRQPIEGQNVQRIGKGVVGAKQVTVSFYVKASASFTFGCELFDVTAERQCTKLFSTTTDWVRHEITFPPDVDDGSSPFNDDNTNELELNFWLHAGSTFTGGTLNTAAFANQSSANRAPGIDSIFSNTANNFFLTGVQLEVGPVASEFEQEDFSTTLAKCQRYYEQSYDIGTFAGATTQSSVEAIRQQGSNGVTTVQFKQNKRAAPTMVYYSSASGTSGKARNNDAGADVNCASLNNGQVSNSVVISGADEAYLHYHYTADAEL